MNKNKVSLGLVIILAIISALLYFKYPKSNSQLGKKAFEAVMYNDLVTFKAIVDKNPQLIGEYVDTKWKRTYLYEAVASGSIPFVKYIFSKGHNTKDIFTDKLLFKAIWNHDIKMVECLLKEGFSVKTTVIDGNTTLLDWACNNSFCSDQRDFEIIDLLIKFGANINDNQRGDVPLITRYLHEPAIEGNIEDIKWSKTLVIHLLETSKVKINRVHPTHGTYLSHAFRWGYEGVVKKMLECGADPTLGTSNETTPLAIVNSWLTTPEIINDPLKLEHYSNIKRIIKAAILTE